MYYSCPATTLRTAMVCRCLPAAMAWRGATVASRCVCCVHGVSFGGLQSGYKGFGSFHSDNLEELLRIPDSEYVHPANDDLAAVDALLETSGGVPAPFGTAFRRYMCLDESWTFVNHGAFGGTLALALERAHGWRLRLERQPLLFIDRELFPLIVSTMRQFARFIGAAPTDFVFVPNATTGCVQVVCGGESSREVLRRLGPRTCRVLVWALLG